MGHIALIGGSGNAGSRILKELSDRGHKVTAIARNPKKIAALPGVVAKKGNVFDTEGLSALLKGHDAVISSVHFLGSDPHRLLEAVRVSAVKRYLVVGGAAAWRSHQGSAWSISQISRRSTRKKRWLERHSSIC